MYDLFNMVKIMLNTSNGKFMVISLGSQEVKNKDTLHFSFKEGLDPRMICSFLFDNSITFFFKKNSLL